MTDYLGTFFSMTTRKDASKISKLIKEKRIV